MNGKGKSRRVGLLSETPASFPVARKLMSLQGSVPVAAMKGRSLWEGGMEDDLVEGCARLCGLSGEDWERELGEWVRGEAVTEVWVMGFGKRIPETLLEGADNGFWNFHPGPLPDYRGPDPIFWQLLHGRHEVAVTVHLMTPELDEGPVMEERKLMIEDRDTYGSVLRRWGERAAAMTGELYELTACDRGLLRRQAGKGGRQGRPRLEDTVIDWASDDAVAIFNRVRACNPNHGGAKVKINGRVAQVWSVARGSMGAGTRAGQVAVVNDEGVHVGTVCGTGVCLRVASNEDGIQAAHHWARMAGAGPGDCFAGL